MTALTAKQQRFVQEYLVTLSQKEAAIRAGYKPSSADLAGWKMMKLPQVRAAIRAGQRAIEARVEVRQDEVLQGYLDIGFLDPAECFNRDGSMKNIHDMPLHVRMGISSVEVYEEFGGKGDEREVVGLTKKLRFWDKLKALDSLGRTLGLFNADTSKKPTVNVLALLLERIDGRGLPRIAGD